jgi:hypothetical protein
MTEEHAQPGTPVDRLCSEIQLFDLCDLDKCSYRKDRFCTNELLLGKFEAIREEDDRQTLLYDEDDLEGDDESDFDYFDEEDEGNDQD